MSDTRKRYTNLTPLTTEEMQYYALAALAFFSPIKYKENCTLLGITPDLKQILPMSFGDFLSYIKRTTNDAVDPYKNMNNIEVLTHLSLKI